MNFKFNASKITPHGFILLVPEKGEKFKLKIAKPVLQAGVLLITKEIVQSYNNEAY